MLTVARSSWFSLRGKDWRPVVAFANYRSLSRGRRRPGDRGAVVRDLTRSFRSHPLRRSDALPRMLSLAWGPRVCGHLPPPTPAET